MSSFTLIVVGDNPLKQLIPFQDNNRNTCPKEYLTFHDVTEESLAHWKEETLVFKHRETGQLISYWLRPEQMLKPAPASVVRYLSFLPRFRWHEKLLEIYPSGYENDFFRNRLQYVDSTGYKIVNATYQELIPDFDQYMTEWMGYSIDPEKGVYGYWENPNGHWTSYWLTEHSDEGRLFLLKRNKSHKYPDKSIIKGVGVDWKNRYVVSARKSDIDFEGTSRKFSNSFPTAVLVNGEWLERNWEDDSGTWEAIVERTFKEVKDRELLTIVQCYR